MNEELAKQLCLKVVYGGVLSEEEKPVLDSFIETEAGQQYLSQSREMRLVLTGIAKVDLIPAVPQDLAKSFVATYRGKSKTSQSAVCFYGNVISRISAACPLHGIARGFCSSCRYVAARRCIHWDTGFDCEHAQQSCATRERCDWLSERKPRKRKADLEPKFFRDNPVGSFPHDWRLLVLARGSRSRTCKLYLVPGA